MKFHYNKENCFKGVSKTLLLTLVAIAVVLCVLPVRAQEKSEARSDSLRILELTVQLEEMKLNELMLKSKLADDNHHSSDSVKRAEKLRQIDSLRNETPGIPVIIENDTLFKFYASRGGHSALDRAETTVAMIKKISENSALTKDSVYLLDNETYMDIMYGDKVIMSVTEQDALWQGTTVDALAEQLKQIISDKIKELREENSVWWILKKIALFLVVIFVLFMLVRLVNFVFRRVRKWEVCVLQTKLKPVKVHEYEILNVTQVCRIFVIISNIVRYAVILILIIITIPILFSIFPQTENLAYQIYNYIVDPIKMVGKAIFDYIPNLFIIAVIWIVVRYVVKGLRYISNEIKNEKLKFSGFYPDWAEPTFNIIRFLLYMFMIALIYPYLPGSNSGVFRGISVFVGVIVSLGSSTIISNFIAGFVITYMRPFKKGDFIKVQDTVGNVVEKTPFLTRVRTIKNEMVTIPNTFIVSSNTVNYTHSANKYGLIIHTKITMGYDVPWRTVHGLLIDAALATKGVLEHPAPFVLETEADDYYMCYQINAYIKDADDMPFIMSDLLQNIQDAFNAAGIEMFAPHHFTTKNTVSVSSIASPLQEILSKIVK